ncbi:MAG: RNA polymerase sigma factor [Oscillospiraceae bacterium]|nr:RNA polymerase sigma factor [Oscillospiraceae bacterium]
MEDGQIVDLFLARDEAAIQRSAEKYGLRLRGLALHIVQEPQTAEECENDAYLAAWNAIPPHAPRDYLYAFLARIVRNVALNCCRDRRRLKRDAFIAELSREMEECLPAPDDLESRLDDMALREALNGFLGTLGEEKRNIFLRRYWYLDPIAEIAKRFGITQSKVKTTLFRVRNQLREYLEKEGYTL